jgi:hypothetical protein
MRLVFRQKESLPITIQTHAHRTYAAWWLSVHDNKVKEYGILLMQIPITHDGRLHAPNALRLRQ